MINFPKITDRDGSKPRWPRIIAKERYTSFIEYKGNINSIGPTKREHEVVIREEEGGRRIISFGWPWEYDADIYDYPKPNAKPGTIGASPPAHKHDRNWMLDMGGNGCPVWLEPEEARRIFSWAKPYMLKEIG